MYLAKQDALNRVVALKVIRPEHLEHAKIRRRFIREAETMASLSHPNLVQVYACGVEGPAPYIAMEYLPAGSLADRLVAAKQSGQPALDLPACEALARETLEALAVLHEARVVHRDLKPGNILLREDGQAVVADLGLVGFDDPAATRLTRTGAVVGTPSYMPPECLDGVTQADARSDLFALGLILYRCVAGRHPTAGAPIRPDFEAVRVERYRSDCPAPLAGLIGALLERDPTRRPASAAEALGLLGESGGAASPGAGPRPPSGEPPAKPPASTTAVEPTALAPSTTLQAVRRPGLLLALVLLVVAAGWFLRPRRLDLEVRAGSRRVHVRTPGAHPGLFLVARDASGALVAEVAGEPGPESTDFVLPALEPDSSYRLRILAGRSDEDRELLAQERVHTLPRLEVLGTSPGPEGPQLWLRAAPETTLRADGRELTVGAAPVALPVGTEDLAIGIGDTARLVLRSRAAPSAPGRLADLGLAVSADEVSALPGEELRRWGWMAALLGESGAPFLDPARHRAWSRDQGLQAIVEVPGFTPPAEAAWARVLADGDWEGFSPPLLQMVRHGFESQGYAPRPALWGRRGERSPLAQATGAWREFLSAEAPEFELLPPPWVLGRALGAGLHLRFWNTAFGRIDAIGSAAVHRPRAENWREDWRQLREGCAAQGVPCAARRVWLSPRMGALGRDSLWRTSDTLLEVLSHGGGPGRERLLDASTRWVGIMGRRLVLARRFFPEAVVLVDARGRLEELTAARDRGRGAGAAGDFRWLAERLAGLRFDAAGAAEAAGWMVAESEFPLEVSSFRAGARRVHVVLHPTMRALTPPEAERSPAPARIRWTPTRPGVLSQLRGRAGPSLPDRVLGAGEVASFELGTGAAVFEELTPAELVGDAPEGLEVALSGAPPRSP